MNSDCALLFLDEVLGGRGGRIKMQSCTGKIQAPARLLCRVRRQVTMSSSVFASTSTTGNTLPRCVYPTNNSKGLIRQFSGGDLSQVLDHCASPTNTSKMYNNNSYDILSSGKIRKRSMVTITKTKAADLQQEEDELEASVGTSSQNMTYKFTSDVLNVTPSCLNRIEELVKKRNEPAFLRVFVDAGGCSGFTYQFEIDTEIDEEDDTIVVVTDDNGGDDRHRMPRVVVDESSLTFLHGATLDFAQEMIKSAFVVIDNPQSESACGCGSSFAAKNFAANPAVD